MTRSSQGKKRRSSSASDTHRVLKSQVTSTFIYIYIYIKCAKNSTQNIKTGGFRSKDMRQNRSKKESTPLRTHCLIYFINVKMSRVNRLLCGLRMSDVTYPHMMVCIMYHVITYFAKYSWIRASQRVVDLALNHCRTLSTL